MLHKIPKICLFASALLISEPAYAKRCEVESFYRLCTGCSINLKWKIKKSDRSDRKKWCSFAFRRNNNAKLGFTIIDSFALGKIWTGYYTVKLSGLKIGSDRVVLNFHGVDRWGKHYTSTLNFDVQVVEGNF